MRPRWGVNSRLSACGPTAAAPREDQDPSRPCWAAFDKLLCLSVPAHLSWGLLPGPPGSPRLCSAEPFLRSASEGSRGLPALCLSPAPASSTPHHGPVPTPGCRAPGGPSPRLARSKASREQLLPSGPGASPSIPWASKGLAWTPGDSHLDPRGPHLNCPSGLPTTLSRALTAHPRSPSCGPPICSPSPWGAASTPPRIQGGG